jgi:hypothetical protein
MHTANGWKILVDYDYTSQEKKFNVTEKDFLAAKSFISGNR